MARNERLMTLPGSLVDRLVGARSWIDAGLLGEVEIAVQAYWNVVGKRFLATVMFPDSVRPRQGEIDKREWARIMAVDKIGEEAIYWDNLRQVMISKAMGNVDIFETNLLTVDALMRIVVRDNVRRVEQIATSRGDWPPKYTGYVEMTSLLGDEVFWRREQGNRKIFPVLVRTGVDNEESLFVDIEELGIESEWAEEAWRNWNIFLELLHSTYDNTVRNLYRQRAFNGEFKTAVKVVMGDDDRRVGGGHVIMNQIYQVNPRADFVEMSKVLAMINGEVNKSLTEKGASSPAVMSVQEVVDNLMKMWEAAKGSMGER